MRTPLYKSDSKTMRPLGEYIDQRLTEQAHLCERLTLSVRSRLPSPLAEHCWVGTCDGETLRLLTDSSAWTVSLRYQQREILKQVNAEFREELKIPLKKLRVIVTTPEVPPTEAARRPHRRPSPGNADSLVSVAHGVADENLRAALLRLAGRKR
ncbi:MAG: DciA family protein [Gammaproteobacteria bacterium]